MGKTRKAHLKDCARIAEILVFNFRLNFYPIFRNEEFYFKELEVVSLAQRYAVERALLDKIWVYEEGIIKGFMEVEQGELKKLYVDSFFQNEGIGAQLLKQAVALGVVKLWALEKNERALKFYARHGFLPNGEKKLEEGTDAYLIQLQKQ